MTRTSMRSAGSDDLSALLDALPDGTIKIDASGLVKYVNRAAARLLRGQADAVNISIADAAPEFPSSFIRDLLSGGSGIACEYEYKGEWRRADVTTIDDTHRLIRIRSDVYLQREVGRRKQAETALDVNQAFLQAVLDHIDTGIVACDANGTLRLFNNATRVFHGMRETAAPPEEWSQRYNLFYADGVTPLRKEDIPLYRAFSGESVKKAEIVIVGADGQRRTVLSSGGPLLGRDGRRLGAVVAMQDITHRKLYGARIRQALRRFRDLFNDAPIAYHEIDVHGIVRRVNRAECRVLGHTRKEIVGRPVWEFVAEGDRENVRTAILEKLAGARALQPFETEYVMPSGKRLMFEIHENAMLDATGAITGLRTAMLDITDRHQRQLHAQALAEERSARALAEATSAEIRSILERIGDAYIAFDTEWRYTYVNHKAEELALKPASELLGRSVWDEFPEAVHTPFYSELHRSMREQIPVEFENHYEPLGKYFENSVYPSPSGVGVFYRDITERVLAQHALEKRTKEIALKNAELEMFASVASHDLKEPLRMIGGYASLLSRRYSNVLDSDAKEFLSFMTQGVDRMQRLIRDLLALCRMDATSPESLVAVNLEVPLDIVKHNLEFVIADSGAVVSNGELPTIRCNETHILQVLQNLVANALKYRSAEPPRIHIWAEREQGAWKIAVRDNGSGFDMHFADQVFQPFRRLQRRDDDGTGIGLAICKKVIEGRGGRIWVESAPGIGSTFFFTIPDAIPTSD